VCLWRRLENVAVRRSEIISKNDSSSKHRHILNIPDTAVEASQPASTSPQAAQFRSEMGHISRHSAVFFAGTLFTAGAGYLYKIYLARVLGAEALGIYALGMTVGGVLGLIAALGLPQAAARYVAVYNGTGRYAELKGFLWRGIAVLAAANLMVAAIMLSIRGWVADRFYHTPALSKYMGAFAVLMVMGSFTLFFGQSLAGFKDVARRTVITNFIGSPLNMLFGVGLLLFGMGLSGYLLAQIASGLITVVLLALATWKLMPPGDRSPASELPGLQREVIRFSASLFAVQVLEYTFASLDKIVLGHYLDARSVGIYVVAASVTTFLPILLQSVNQIFSPTIADLHARREMAVLQRLYQTLTKWILGFTLPLAIVVCVFAAPLMQIFGSEFRVGWPILIIGTFGQLINCAAGSAGILLIMSGHQNRLVRVQVKVVIGNIIFNLALIPIWGVIGAIVVSAATNAAINLLYLREVKSILGLTPYNRSYIRLFLPVLGSAAIVALVRMEASWFHHVVLAIVVGLLLGYLAFIALVLLAGLDEDDRLVAGAIRSRVRGMFGMTRLEVR
jgi:O-antigen/teichoic acid export membrane protein